METLRPVPSVRPTRRSSIYVVAVALIATVGFVKQSPWPILLAGLLTLPASILAVPCYYLVYGVLALVPGANPSSSTGYRAVNADGTTIASVTTGTQATWFVVTTQALGILAFTVAAILTVILLRFLLAQRQTATGVPPVRPA